MAQESKIALREQPANDSIESFVNENLKTGLTELDRLVEVEENESVGQLSNLGLTTNCLLFLCMGILFAVNTAESILYKYAAEPIPGQTQKSWTPFLGGLPFWFDAIGRVLVLAYFANWTSLTSLPLTPWITLFGIRILCQTGYCFGVSSISLVGAGTKKVLEQLTIPIVAGIRYFWMRKKINAAQILFACAVCCAAFGFQVEDIGAVGGAVEGLVMMLISVTFCSCAYCCSEYFLQNTLAGANLTIVDKNMMFAIADIPVMIAVLFFDVFCERVLQGQPRSWNIFQGIDGYCVALIFNSIIFGIVKYPILDWANSLVLSIVLTLATALTWVVELVLPKDAPEFSKTKLAIVCILIFVSIGFQWEGMNREKQKQKRNILVAKERVQVLQKVKNLL